MSKSTKYLLIFIVAMIVLTPLGTLAEGVAWGEWDAETFKQMLGFVPSSIESAKPIVEPAIPDYEIGGLNAIFSSIASAAIGAVLLLVVLFGIKKIPQK